MTEVKVIIFCESSWICGYYGNENNHNCFHDAKEDDFERCLNCEAFQLKVKK